jgi:hypothetical protein
MFAIVKEDRVKQSFYRLDCIETVPAVCTSSAGRSGARMSAL